MSKDTGTERLQEDIQPPKNEPRRSVLNNRLLQGMTKVSQLSGHMNESNCLRQELISSHGNEESLHHAVISISSRSDREDQSSEDSYFFRKVSKDLTPVQQSVQEQGELDSLSMISTLKVDETYGPKSCVEECTRPITTEKQSAGEETTRRFTVSDDPKSARLNINTNVEKEHQLVPLRRVSRPKIINDANRGSVGPLTSSSSPEIDRGLISDTAVALDTRSPLLTRAESAKDHESIEHQSDFNLDKTEIKTVSMKEDEWTAEVENSWLFEGRHRQDSVKTDHELFKKMDVAESSWQKNAQGDQPIIKERSSNSAEALNP